MKITDTKLAPVVQLKAGPADGLDEGIVEALISVYGVNDTHRQRVPGPESFEAYAGAVNDGQVKTPVVWQHKIDDPWLYVGEVKSATPDGVGLNGERGLVLEMGFDIDPALENPTAVQAYRQVKGRRIPQWSYRWTGTATKASDGVDELSDMWIHESSPVLQGAVSATHTLGVKAAGGKAYVDIDVPGSFEAVQSALCDALRERYPAQNMGDPYASLVATLGDRAAYQLEGGESEGVFWVDYAIGSDGVAELGDPSPATVSLKGVSAGGMMRSFTTEQRVALAKKGWAIPVKDDAGDIVDGRYPIETESDLENAISAIGRVAAGDREMVIAHIKRQASRLGATDKIPDGWKATAFSQLAVVDFELAQLDIAVHVPALHG